MFQIDRWLVIVHCNSTSCPGLPRDWSTSVPLLIAKIGKYQQVKFFTALSDKLHHLLSADQARHSYRSQ